MTDLFARRLLDWFDGHGRKDLPWQREPTPYRVWVSEVMLQQTQVTTVIPYFERFMARFPSLAELAASSLDEVLAHWAGLGYYSRARNLHAAARVVMSEHGGEFPQVLDEVTALPGIGRSTAGAILALASGQRHPILDGNVKRVLTRFHAVDGWPGQPAVERQLWQLAEEHTPQERVGAYTQAIMDLGATLCTRSRPRCADCPQAEDCRGLAGGEPTRFPAAKPRKAIPVRQATMLLLSNDAGELLLQQRPPSGIWGGLWSLPEVSADEDVSAWCARHGLAAERSEQWAPLRHTFSHFHLDITPQRMWVKPTTSGKVMEPDGAVWYKTDLCHQLGLPAPIKRLIGQLANEFEVK